MMAASEPDSGVDQLGLEDDGVWEAIDTLDRARTRFYERTGHYTSIGGTELRERARRYLLTLEPSVQGRNGSGKLWRAACMLVKGFGIDPMIATEMLIDDFSGRCDPPWSIDELMRACWRANRTPDREPRGYLLRRGRST